MSISKYFNQGSQVTATLSVALSSTAIAVESTVNELLLAGTDIEECNNDILSMESIAVGLEGLGEVALLSLEDGGLDRTSGTFLQLGVESYTTRLGMHESVTPSVESFGGASERVNSTTIAVEGIKEVAKSVWAAITKAIRASIAYVKAWFRKLMEALPAIKKRAESIKDKAENGDIGTIDKKDFELGGLVKAMTINDSVASIDDVLGSLKGAATTYLSKTNDSRIKNLEKIADELKFQDTVPTNGYKDLADLVTVAATGAKSKNKLTGDKRFVAVGVAYTHSDHLPGNKMVVSSELASTPTEDRAGVAKAISAFKVTMTTSVEKPKDIKGTTKVSTLATSAIIKACDEVISIVEIIEGFNKEYSKVESAKEAIIKAGDAVTSNYSDDTKTEVKNFADTQIKVANVALVTIDNPGITLTGHIASTVKSVLSLCDKSLSNYKVAE